MSNETATIKWERIRKGQYKSTDGRWRIISGVRPGTWTLWDESRKDLTYPEHKWSSTCGSLSHAKRVAVREAKRHQRVPFQPIHPTGA